jgi:hypothetical protein
MKKIIGISIIILSCLPLFAQENDKKWGFGLGYEYTLPSKINADNIINSEHSGMHKLSLQGRLKLGNKIWIVSGIGSFKEKINIDFSYYNRHSSNKDTSSLEIKQYSFFVVPLYIEYTFLQKQSNNMSIFGGTDIFINKKGSTTPDFRTTYDLYGYAYDGPFPYRGLNSVLGIKYTINYKKLHYSILLKYNYCIIDDSFHWIDIGNSVYMKKNNSQFSVGINVSL